MLTVNIATNAALPPKVISLRFQISGIHHAASRNRYQPSGHLRPNHCLATPSVTSFPSTGWVHSNTLQYTELLWSFIRCCHGTQSNCWFPWRKYPCTCHWYSQLHHPISTEPSKTKKPALGKLGQKRRESPPRPHQRHCPKYAEWGIHRNPVSRTCKTPKSIPAGEQGCVPTALCILQPFNAPSLKEPKSTEDSHTSWGHKSMNQSWGIFCRLCMKNT